MLFIEFYLRTVVSFSKWMILRLTLGANAAESGKTKSHDKNRCTAGNRG